MAYTPKRGDISNRKTVGPLGDFATLKEAVDWFNASASVDTEILLDAGPHEVDDTIVVNNATYALSVKGVGLLTSKLTAVAGLANKPMFDVRSGLECTRLGATGSTLVGYGVNAGEDFIRLNGSGGKFIFCDNLNIDTFHTGIRDLIGDYVLAVDFLFTDMVCGVEVNHANPAAEFIDVERATMEGCETGINLVAAPNDRFIIRDIVLDNPSSGTSVGIKFAPAAYFFSQFSEIIGCTHNGVDSFTSGFDWAAAATANITFRDNIGQADNCPMASLMVEGNTDGTVCTNSNTWYEADLGTDSSIAAAVFTGSGLDDCTSGGAYVGAVDRNYVAKIDGLAVWTPAYLTGDTGAESTAATWEAVTDGAFQITINGVARDITGIDFTGDASMDDVAATIQAAIRAATSSTETCVWSTNRFIISSVDTTITSAITVTTAGSAGTDISGAGGSDWMDCDVGNGVVTNKVLSTADTFTWSNDDGVTWEAAGVAITGAAQNLEDGVQVTFAATSGHTVTDYWTIVATAYTFNTKLTRFTVVGKALKYLPDIKTDIAITCVASVTSSSNNRTLRMAVVKNDVTATPVAAFSLRLTASATPFNLVVMGCAEDIAKDDEFKVYLNCTSAGGTTFVVQDLALRLEEK